MTMPIYKVQCIKNAEHTAPEPIFLFMKNFDNKREVNCYFWLIRGENQNILVDTGMGGEYDNPLPKLAESHKDSFAVSNGEDTISQLKKFGLSPEDIDIVILTHLHYDHIANIPLFRNDKSKIYVNRKGWEFAKMQNHPVLNPFPMELIHFVENSMKLQLCLNEDEQEIVPGISVIWTGGHTMCSQAVKINTEKGYVILTGDVAYLYDNLEMDHPIGLALSVYEAIVAMGRLRKEADILLPGHDKEILNRYPDGRIV